uniref:Putative glutathione s-transferase n=1 Tax=Amblyomma triste TaxID=251400 RepID=A0A023GG50_AMBTT
MPATLYNLLGSPPCNFVRSLARHLGVEMSMRDLDVSKKEHLSEEYSKLNPFHRIPTLDDDGFVVYESNAIAYYLLRKYAPESELYPSCLKLRTRIDQLLAVVSSEIHPKQQVFLRPRFWDKTKPPKEEVAAYERDVLGGMEHLIGESKFALGDKLTLADLCLVSNLAIALENGSVDRAKFPKLVSYYERMKAELAYFDEIYRSSITNLQQRWAELN